MTSSKNLPMIHKQSAKRTTAVVEHPMAEDDLTHPGLYRFKRNSLPCYTYHQSTVIEKPVNNNANANADWDLYPGLIRDIENEGTPQQVDILHRMQNNTL